MKEGHTFNAEQISVVDIRGMSPYRGNYEE